MRCGRRCIRGFLLIVLLFPAAACAPSAKIPYARHLSTVISPGTGPNDNIAIAFRIDQYADSETAVAVDSRRIPEVDESR